MKIGREAIKSMAKKGVEYRGKFAVSSFGVDLECFVALKMPSLCFGELRCSAALTIHLTNFGAFGGGVCAVSSRYMAKFTSTPKVTRDGWLSI